MTNPTNNTPSNHHDWQRGHMGNVSLGRSPRTPDIQRTLLEEEIEHDVWLEECLAYVQTQEDE